MSENVNLLIEKMNQETLKKNKFLGSFSTNPQGPDQDNPENVISNRMKAAEKEMVNTDKQL